MPLLSKISAWFARADNVQSAVLFGSSARANAVGAPSSSLSLWEDVDLHVIASDARELEQVEWCREFSGEGCRLQVARPATGGVRKVTAIFAGEQMDLVIVPAKILRLAMLAERLGWDRRFRFVGIALDEMATCLHTGYRFLKGEERWGAVYSRVAQRSGVRLTDTSVIVSADTFLCDLLWVFQKIERGELIAAQHVLHTRLVDTNLRLWRELRFRRGQAMPSFGLGRRVEGLATSEERHWLEVSAHLERGELTHAAWNALDGLAGLMRELAPGWGVPPGMADALGASRLRLRAE